jgi:hypothetical protein
MRSTPTNCLGGLSGIPPLAERFAYLNFRYLVPAFCLGHPLKERLGALEALTMGDIGYSDVLSLDKVPSEFFTRHPWNPYGERTC